MSSPEGPAFLARMGNWLQAIGFVHGNPFATSEADREARLLPEFFIDTGYYDVLWGDPRNPQTVVLFAPRGSGKTAHRVMVQSQCRPARPQADVLAVPYTNFEPVLAGCRGDPAQIRAQDHIREILRQGLSALLDTLCDDCSLATSFPPPLRSRLAWFCYELAPHLLGPLEILGRLQAVDPSFQPDWRALQKGVRGGELKPLIAGLGLLDEPVGEFIVDLIDGEPEPFEPGAPLLDLFAAFVEMAQRCGLAAVYILVDRLDELPETAGGPEAVVDLLEPLLAHLRLMEMPGAAFKLCLPEALRDTLLARPTIRQDRLLIRDMSWSDDLLEEMARKRILAYSAGKYRSLGQICSSPLDGRIDREIVQYADGSPRRLLRLGELLFRAHCRDSADVSVLLSQSDWGSALATFRREYMPLLRFDERTRQVYVGARRVELSAMEYDFLYCLYRGRGYRDKEELAQMVWGDVSGVVTDQAISRLARRVREKIELDAGNPVYLLTERSRGFRLEHVAWPES
jgi:hypothetical protein